MEIEAPYVVNVGKNRSNIVESDHSDMRITSEESSAKQKLLFDALDHNRINRTSKPEGSTEAGRIEVLHKVQEMVQGIGPGVEVTRENAVSKLASELAQFIYKNGVNRIYNDNGTFTVELAEKKSIVLEPGNVGFKDKHLDLERELKFTSQVEKDRFTIKDIKGIIISAPFRPETEITELSVAQLPDGIIQIDGKGTVGHLLKGDQTILLSPSGKLIK